MGIPTLGGNSVEPHPKTLKDIDGTWTTTEPINVFDAPANAAGWAMDVASNEPARGRYKILGPNDEVGGRTGEYLGGVGAPKCNVFVYDALRRAGIAPLNGGPHPPQAADWANPDKLPDYRVVGPDEPLQPGDVIATDEHVGIYTPISLADGTIANATTSAAAMNTDGNPFLGGPVTNDWGFRGPNGTLSSGVTVRRYITPQRPPAP